MAANPTYMHREIQEIPAATRKLLREGRKEFITVARHLRDANPCFITTAARGSSDHAASLLKYSAELTLGLPVASVGPSVASVFGATLQLGQGACVAISQSGQSPDIVSLARAATHQGAVSVAITNQTTSPLAQACAHTIDIRAGVEKSVAATKTYVTSAVACLALVAHWRRDEELIHALDALPDYLEMSLEHDWAELGGTLQGKNAMYVLGRGPSLAISNEAALKFKETCRIQAASYSSAEVLHGPVALIEPGYPVLALASRDRAEHTIADVADGLADRGAAVHITSTKSKRAGKLGFTATSHPLTDPLALIVSFYSFIEQLARSRQLDPDKPSHLNKVTETV